VFYLLHTSFTVTGTHNTYCFGVNSQIQGELRNLNIIADRATQSWMLWTLGTWSRSRLGAWLAWWTWPPAHRRPWAFPRWTTLATIKHTYHVTVSITNIRTTSWTWSQLHCTTTGHGYNTHITTSQQQLNTHNDKLINYVHYKPHCHIKGTCHTEPTTTLR